MIELFPDKDKVFSPKIPDGEFYYYPTFLKKKEAVELFLTLQRTIPWKHDKIKVFGKVYDQPRLTSLHALENKPYSYSNITMHPHPFTNELQWIHHKIQKIGIGDYNCVLLNLYRNGSDSNGWHADNEPELGKNPIIASLSLGEERYFHLKHRHLNDQRYKIRLRQGSLLIMAGSMQHYWLHQIPKTAKSINPRINLTFRSLI